MSLYVARDDAMQFVRPTVDEERLFHVLACFQVLAHRLFRSRGDEDDAHLLALTAHRELVAGQVDVRIERTELGHAESGGEEELEYRAVAQIRDFLVLISFLRIRLAGRFHKPLKLGGSDEVGLTLREL